MGTSLCTLRNFSIVAHIDHGKSTLADRILQHTGALTPREMKEQFLDQMDLERERGITIKSQTARLHYEDAQQQRWIFNLIDTPGHVDFGYEVQRCMAACEAALLLVDASQGVQAQTVANTYLALQHDLTIVPVINKIDLPSADPQQVRQQIEEILGIPADDAVLVSGKTGAGVVQLLQTIAQRVPPPQGDSQAPLQALIFDSWFDAYRGVVALVRVMQGCVAAGDTIQLMHGGGSFTVQEIGAFAPKPVVLPQLSAGEVGFVVASIKSVHEAQVGDTITHANRPAVKPLAGFQKAQPMVFSGIFPTEGGDYTLLRDALEKLALNDAALTFEPETSTALGHGFRCGFLGLLHMEVVQERLEREFDLDLLMTAPTVVYRAQLNSGETISVDNPSRLPEAGETTCLQEPFIQANIHTPTEYLGPLIALCQQRRGRQISIDYASRTQATLVYHMPMAEVVFDFFDTLKSMSHGYASLDYEPVGYEVSQLVRIDILLNGDKVDALSLITHRSTAYQRGRALCEKLRSLIPKQQFQIAIQAAIGSKVIARETISALRKDVTAKCYGGDISRKRKLLEKQKKGKKRMRQVGQVSVPQSAFLAILKT
ncbi:MAG: translation elongation factor 4 [Myxococcota bacterium]